MKNFEEFVNESTTTTSTEFLEALKFLRTTDYKVTEDGVEIMVDPEDIAELKRCLDIVIG